MLQYPIQLPPLSLSPKIATKESGDFFRYNDPSPRLSPKSLNNKRIPKEARPSFPGIHHPSAIPLSISTNLSTPSSPSSSSPSTASFKLPRSPYISSRQISNPTTHPWSPPLPSDSLRPASVVSSTIEDVLAPGDLVGQGGLLQGEQICLVSIGSTPRLSDYEEPAKEFQVVRRLGTGSYAVVYLVLEVLSRPPTSDDGHQSVLGPMDLGIGATHQQSTIYGREYAIKCLSKANLDEEALAAQMSEVTIHQSLRSHPNIVTLHRTLETSSFLLLLLEYVPGEDLFYFLEQARDHYVSDSPDSDDSFGSSSHTPPTPSLLSTLHPSQLLSRTRLRLISSMFSQMCDAVAACHSQHVFHRDIKPENFIVTDGWTAMPDGSRERKVIVKLTDFGLSTTDLQSSDMDCGSAPYMSYECRNNVAPTYSPRAADVWSLGIVLINMLYHYNPWTDTSSGACSSFDLFCQQPVSFFLNRFTGMTRPVAEFLANEVFCILDDPQDDSQRIPTSEFGAWARDLPLLLGDHSGYVPQRITSTSSTQGHPISSSMPVSHRPSSRQASSTPAIRTPAIQSRSLSRAPSLGPTYEREPSDLPTVYDQELDELDDDVEDSHSRSTSTNKRRKRGARKGKGVVSPVTPKDETLATLAVASQSLAREISRASKKSSTKTSASSKRVRPPFEPVSMYPMPTPLLTQPKSPTPLAHIPKPTAPAPSTAPVVVKKSSKWKLSFGKNNSVGGHASPVEEILDAGRDGMSVTASNVTSLIMGLSAPAPYSPVGAQKPSSDTWSRGRRTKIGDVYPSSLEAQSSSPLPNVEPWAQTSDNRSERAISPNSTRSTRPVTSSASSVVSSNWRSSISTTSSASNSTSAFTRYSNSSTRSVSTTATSVSASSWRTTGKLPNSQEPVVPGLPKNIKYMTGVPWEVSGIPRMQSHPPGSDIFGSPPVRKKRVRKPKDAKLDTITERPIQKSLESQRMDASTSTTDLSGVARDGGIEDADSPKKVQKGQITALAKMLSALRR